MVVTGLHLLGGARADATRVRSGADRAVVEGRFTTTDLDDATVAGLQAVLDSSGAERDEDGSVIALRSISRDGPSRAYLGGRGVPAKSLSGFTNELLTLHGQNDQLRLMRPDEQRGALDRFAAAGEAVQRYRKLRDAWLTARRDLVDRRNRARELAQEADRLKFALNEIDTVDPQPGRTWRWSPTSPGFPNWTPCGRPRLLHARRCAGHQTRTHSTAAPSTASGGHVRHCNRAMMPRCGVGRTGR